MTLLMVDHSGQKCKDRLVLDIKDETAVAFPARVGSLS